MWVGNVKYDLIRTAYSAEVGSKLLLLKTGSVLKYSCSYDK